jgi:polyferredoxin
LKWRGNGTSAAVACASRAERNAWGRIHGVPPSKKEVTMRLLLVILVILLLVGALPTWPYSTGWGYYPAGGVGLILLVLIVLAVVGVL